MAFLNETINLNDLPEGNTGEYQPLPAGEYTATVKSADLTPTKDGTGQYLKLRLDIVGPSHSGRVVFSNININNKSPKAEEIGRRQLGDLMRACGIPQLSDTDQFIGHTIAVKVDVRNDPTYGASNEVKAYKAVKGSAPPMPAEAPAAAAPKPAATGGAAPPWAKK